MMKLHFCGGADEIGASCILLELENRKILLDCGMRMKRDPLPDFQKIKEIGNLDAILLSHAHMDHSGTLPIICSEFPYADIWMTKPTEAVTKVLLYDSLKIMDNEDEIPKYNKKQVESFLKNIKTTGYTSSFSLFEESEIKVTFYPAGHIIGAASIYIESTEGSIFYSGDISLTDQRTVGSFSIPRLRPDICILESTYGNRMHSNRKVEESRLIETVSETLNNEGRVLIPAFAVGRAQEVILTLRSAINRGMISKDIKVYIDGMVRQICTIYRSFPNFLKESLAKRIWHGNDVFFSDNVVPVSENKEREKIINDKEPCCIISSSGMLTGGPSSLYAEKIAEDENSMICITGYQDEESPGRRLQNLCSDDSKDKTWTVNGKAVNFKCKTGTYSLSAHADKNELINIVEHLKPKEVFLVHGDAASINSLGSEMQLKCKTYVHAPKLGDSFSFKKFHSKRFIKKIPESLRKDFAPTLENDLSVLSKYLIKLNVKGPWTAAELLQVWGLKLFDSDIEQEFIALLNKSNYFEYDTKRLYLYYANEPNTLPPVSSRVEVNQMLARAADLFPNNTGLYKRGARIEIGTVLLSFRFPSVARKKYSKHFEIFEKETGWKVELNKQPDTSFLRPLLIELLASESCLLGKVSWHLDKDEVHVKFTKKPDNLQIISNSFYEGTHLHLISDYPETKSLDIPANNNIPGGEAVNSQHQYNRTDAVDMIREVFVQAEVQIFKYSIKSDILGDYIEMQFLTPKLGEKYKSWINDLKETIGWRIAVSQNPRQQELIEIAKATAAEHNIPILKGPSIHNSESKVSIKTTLIAANFNEINSKFKEKTGFILEIKI